MQIAGQHCNFKIGGAITVQYKTAVVSISGSALYYMHLLRGAFGHDDANRTTSSLSFQEKT